MQNVTYNPTDSALGAPWRRVRSCSSETRQRVVDYLSEDHKGTLPLKLDEKTNCDSIVADSASMESWKMDADETASQRFSSYSSRY